MKRITNMRFFLTLTIILVGLALTKTVGQESFESYHKGTKFYLGAKYNYIIENFDKNEIRNDALIYQVSNSVSESSNSENASGINFVTGYFYNDYLAIEAGFDYIPGLKGSYTITDIQGDEHTASYNIDLISFNVGPCFKSEIENNLYFKAKLGVMHREREIKTSALINNAKLPLLRTYSSSITAAAIILEIESRYDILSNILFSGGAGIVWGLGRLKTVKYFKLQAGILYYI